MTEKALKTAGISPTLIKSKQLLSTVLNFVAIYDGSIPFG